MEYIEFMQVLDLEIAGEFILMAATLIRIKAQMLLPKEAAEEDAEEEDPRAELVRQLLEYKRFKEVAESFVEIEEKQRRIFPRVYFRWAKKYEEEETEEEVLRDITLFDLLTAFKSVLENMPKESQHQVGAIGVTIEDQIANLLKLLEDNERLVFSELMKKYQERVTVVVTFSAMLELIRMHRIVIQQASLFGEIYICRR
jgi:segregation and condensation protein A